MKTTTIPIAKLTAFSIRLTINFMTMISLHLIGSTIIQHLICIESMNLEKLIQSSGKCIMSTFDNHHNFFYCEIIFVLVMFLFQRLYDDVSSADEAHATM